jgi:hypothetical protein
MEDIIRQSIQEEKKPEESNWKELWYLFLIKQMY